MPPVEIKEVSQLECYRNSLDVCDWCGEEQASELRLLCLEQIWMRATGPSLIFQWCDCSENFLNGATIPKILSRVRLHLAPPKVASPQGYRCTCACFPMVQLHLAPPKEMVLLLLKGATTFSCSEKIILSHHFLISFLWCSWCLIRAQLVSQLICVQLVLLDWGSNQQNLLPITPYTRVAKKKLL